MKKSSSHLAILFILATVFFGSFKSYSQNNLTTDTASEFEILLNHIESNNNFINSDTYPASVSASEVKKNIKNPKYHIIDIRNEAWFEYGHIKGAVNVKSADLLTYFENKIKPKEYDKIVLLCYSGQSSALFTMLLRLAGYDNTYNMKWGMSAWRLDFAENTWLKFTSNDYASKLETNKNSKPEKGDFPTINTGETEAESILKIRLEKAFATPYKEYIINATDVFKNPTNYYIVNYWDIEKYNQGHIPGAVQYQPKTSISSKTDLFTLPIDKKIVIYGSTGQSTACVVAYLNLLGYDAGNLAYGANSFMNQILKEKGWNAFTQKEINTYPVIE